MKKWKCLKYPTADAIVWAVSELRKPVAVSPVMPWAAQRWDTGTAQVGLSRGGVQIASRAKGLW